MYQGTGDQACAAGSPPMAGPSEAWLDPAGPRLKAQPLAWLTGGARAGPVPAPSEGSEGPNEGREPAPRTSQLPKWPFPSPPSGGRQLPFPGKLIPNAGIWAQVHELGLPSSLSLAHPGTHAHPAFRSRPPDPASSPSRSWPRSSEAPKLPAPHRLPCNLELHACLAGPGAPGGKGGSSNSPTSLHACASGLGLGQGASKACTTPTHGDPS